MKLIKILVLPVLLLSATLSNAQSITPSTDSNYCPGTYINFTVTFPGNVQSATVVSVDGSTIPQVTSPQIDHVNGISMAHFRVKFWDLNSYNGQGFKIQYLYLNTSTFQYTSPYRFLKIKTLVGVSQPSIHTDSLTFDYIKKDTFNINFDYSYYITAQTSTSNPTPFEPILDYEYRVPEGWRVNGQVSSNSWIRGNNTATIISDGLHGNNEAIEIRTVNTCNNTYGMPTSIPLSFKKLSLSGDRYLCHDSSLITIPNFPHNATSTWRCDDSTYTGLTKINDSTARLLKSANKTIRVYAIINSPFGTDTTETKTVSFVNSILYASATFTSGTTNKILSICNTLSDEFQNGHYRGYIEITDPTIITAKLNHLNDGQFHPAIITEILPNRKFEVQLHPGNTYENLVLTLSNGCSSKSFYPSFRGPASSPCLDTILSINSIPENFTVSPNPSHGDLQIRNLSKLEINSVEVYNSMGYQKFKKAYHSKAGVLTLNIKNLKKGVYYILIRSNSIVERKKVLIN